ncbi:MAG: hypothetical protein GY839_12665 [candidate division Zixibacteria bacterium]|nr:hypothetical protein [candidate division Zixibacteria bacterium]
MTHGSTITKQAAATITKDFRDATGSGSISFDNGSGTQLKGELFDKGCFGDILEQQGCEGIRIYYGLNANSKFCLVLVGVNSNGDDMEDGEIFEIGSNCPPNCGKPSDLNS